MGKFEYLDKDKELLKVLKLQENDLAALKSNSEKKAADLADIRRRAELLLHKNGIKHQQVNKANKYEKIKISTSDIPSWESITARANEEIPEDVIIEDLLTKEEFQFCEQDVKRINDEFSRKTGLNKTDVAFIAIATALQTARWLIIQELCGDLGQKINSSERISAKEGEKLKHKPLSDFEKNHNDKANIKGQYPSWQEILWGTYSRVDGAGKSKGYCPYDAQSGAPSWFEEGGRGAHRSKTLGHDPILGWIFGPPNIMTSTITLSNFDSYKVYYPGNCFGEPVSTFSVFGMSFESLYEDWLRLPAAIVSHYAHLKSDYFTKAGLPVPLIGSFSEEMAGKLYKSQYDSLCLVKDIKIVASQAAFSILINMVISFVHGLFYNKGKDGSRDFYEARTRKILTISNSLASAGNLAYVIGTEDWRKLDAGGLLVTISRLYSDVRYITKLKKDFIEGEMDKVLENELIEIDKYFV